MSVIIKDQFIKVLKVKGKMNLSAKKKCLKILIYMP